MSASDVGVACRRCNYLSARKRRRGTEVEKEKDEEEADLYFETIPMPNSSPDKNEEEEEERRKEKPPQPLVPASSRMPSLLSSTTFFDGNGILMKGTDHLLMKSLMRCFLRKATRFWIHLHIMSPLEPLQGSCWPLPTPLGTPLYAIPEENRGQQFDVPKEAPGGLPFMKPEDYQYFGAFLNEEEEEQLNPEEQKECKITKLLFKVKNGTPPPLLHLKLIHWELSGTD